MQLVVAWDAREAEVPKLVERAHRYGLTVELTLSRRGCSRLGNRTGRNERMTPRAAATSGAALTLRGLVYLE